MGVATRMSKWVTNSKSRIIASCSPVAWCGVGVLSELASRGFFQSRYLRDNLSRTRLMEDVAGRCAHAAHDSVALKQRMGMQRKSRLFSVHALCCVFDIAPNQPAVRASLQQV